MILYVSLCRFYMFRMVGVLPPTMNVTDHNQQSANTHTDNKTQEPLFDS